MIFTCRNEASPLSRGPGLLSPKIRIIMRIAVIVPLPFLLTFRWRRTGKKFPYRSKTVVAFRYTKDQRAERLWVYLFKRKFEESKPGYHRGGRCGTDWRTGCHLCKPAIEIYDWRRRYHRPTKGWKTGELKSPGVTLSGTVHDDKGAPLPKASVLVKEPP